MILFARSERHACRQAQDIIGVSPVFPIPARDDDPLPERHWRAEMLCPERVVTSDPIEGLET
jgi:hypothetical protein